MTQEAKLFERELKSNAKVMNKQYIGVRIAVNDDYVEWYNSVDDALKHMIVACPVDVMIEDMCTCISITATPIAVDDELKQRYYRATIK